MRTRYLAPFFSTIAALALAACGGGGSAPPAPISISFGTAPPASLATGVTSNISAVVSNDGTNAGISWSISCSSSACGSISPATSASGASVTYTAPSSVPSPAAVTIIAKAAADTTKSVSAAVNITGPQPISVSFAAAPPTSLVVSKTASVAATVANDSKNAGVTWSLSCGSAACGSISPTTSASGASVIYTAPSAVPSPATVAITATSVTDDTKSVAATVTITAAPPPALADGTYVYHLSGQDNDNNYYVAGAFTIKSGIITGGEQDSSDGDQSTFSQLVPSGSAVSLVGNTLEVVLATTNTSFGINGLVTLHGTSVSSTRALVSEFDSFAAATGSIDLQTSPAPLAGGYAFVINGLDDAGNQLAIGGVLNISGQSLSISNSIFDYNDGAGAALFAQGFASGSVTTPDPFGRVTLTLTPNQASGVSPVILQCYVAGNTLQLVEDGSNDSLNGDLGGTALAQGTNAGQFSPSSIQNLAYVYSAEGQDTNGPLALGGAFVFAPGGTATGLMVFNDLTNHNGNSFSGASYRIDPTGRVSISNVVPSSMQNITLGFQLYLDGNGNGLVLGADPIEQSGGLAYLQNGLSDYEGDYAINVRGFLNGPNYEQPYGAVGPVTIATDNVTGTTEYTSQDQNLRPPPSLTPFDNYTNVSLTGAEDMTTGLFHLNGLNSLSFSGSSGFGIYPVDANRVLAIETDGGANGILVLESTSQLQSH
ncbi:MAG: hypothetical protein WBQ95_09475 [Terracidiphilus sp.]